MNKTQTKRINQALTFYRQRLEEARKAEVATKEKGKFFEGYNKATQTVLECVIIEISNILLDS